MPKTIYGKVTSEKGNKTIVITVPTRKTHPLYKKQYTINTKFMAHDEKNEAKLGDMVVISEVRPISARKRFTLVKITQKAAVGFTESDATADVAEETVASKPKTPVPKTKKTETKENQ